MPLVDCRPEEGAKLLDKKWGSGEWARKIARTRLDLFKLSDCPLGQIYGSYLKGLEELGLIREGIPSSEVQLLGFAFFDPDVSSLKRTEVYAFLHEEWLFQIDLRLEELAALGVSEETEDLVE